MAMLSIQHFLSLVLAYSGVSSAVLFPQRKIDCKVSYWSEWEGPRGFGEYERYRTVLAYPANGGNPCPELTETRATGRPLTVNETAQLVIEKFLRRTVRSAKSKRDNDSTRDLLILLDDSGSIGENHYREATKNLADLIGLLCPDPDPFLSTAIQYHQAALIKFSSTPVEEFAFGKWYPTSKLKRAIESLTYTGGSTCTGDAFKEAIEMFRSTNKGVRNNVGVKKEVLILTDGQSNCGYNAIQAAKDLKDATFSSPKDKVEVFGLMIGNYALGEQGRNEMKQYVSNRPGDHLFAVETFQEFNALVAAVKEGVMSTTCQSFDF